MAASRVCSECPRLIVTRDPRAKTCSDACRKRRTRRLARLNTQASPGDADGERGQSEALARLQDVVQGRAGDVGRDVIKDELAPVVREAVTAETLQAVADLVKLTPTAVAKLQEDLESEDVGIRQRAYTLIVKYTIGHPAILSRDDQERAPIQIQVGVPRPAPVEAEAVEVEPPPAAMGDTGFVCDRCGEPRPEDERVGASDRCTTCWAQQRADVEEKYGTTDDPTP